MFQNYFKTAFRNLLRYKGFTIINIASLAIGLLACFVIALFVWDEKQFDRFQGADRTYRIYTRPTTPGEQLPKATVPPAFGPALEREIPGVESTLRLMHMQSKLLLDGGRMKSYEKKGFIAEPSVFSMFPTMQVKGAKNALAQPRTMALSEELAARFFPGEDPLGKTVQVEGIPFVVNAIFRNPPHLHFEAGFLLSFASILEVTGIEPERLERWTWQQFHMYARLKEGVDAAAVQRKFGELVARRAGPAMAERSIGFQPFLQPLGEVHLHSSDFIYDVARQGNAGYVQALSIIAVFILLIAIFNFINLATARSLRRAKEIGVRKVVGADRKQLIMQFTGETILLSVISILIAAVLTMLVLPYLNDFTGKSIPFNPFLNPALGGGILLAGILVGILAGIYPAMVLSGFQPLQVLKQMRLGGSGGGQALLRKALVLVQFTLSVLLIVCAITVYRQMNYLNDKDLGFSKDQVLYFEVRDEMLPKIASFKSELKRSPEVVSVTAGYGLPGDLFAGETVRVPGDPPKDHSIANFIVDPDYVPTLGLELVAGRNFSQELPTDAEETFILNESAVKQMGFGTPQEALGKVIHWDKWIADSVNPVKKGSVIGVVKDFHYKSLHERIGGVVMQMHPYYYHVAVKVKTASLQKTLGFIRETWDRYSTTYPFTYTFMDDQFGKMYVAERKLSTLLWVFTAIAIFIGCMGLFGLAAYSAEQRTKEIGIRKVLGASVLHITGLLSRNFLLIVALASLLAFPIAWMVLHRWLEKFPYRVSVSWWIFGLAAGAALVIALVTTSMQAVRAALANPVKSLRSE